MADLTFQQVLDQLPAGSLTVDADDVLISLGTLMDEATLALSTAKVSEFASKFLDACSKAQVAYNTANPNAQLNGYPAPNFGVPTEIGGNLLAARTHTVTVLAPVELDEITGNPL